MNYACICLARVLATDMCSNSGETGCSEAVALEKFGQDVVYAAISGGRRKTNY